MARSVPPALERARALVLPALRETVERLTPGIREVVEYHLGWRDSRGGRVADDGGKSLRPALVFLSAEAVGGPPTGAIPGAVAVELVHNFSLMHDDVMDGDFMRRHRPTAWRIFGVGRAIVAGDALLALAHGALVDPPSLERFGAAAALSRATASMIEGQADDLAFESRLDVSLEECLTMCANKTAALLACSAQIGALLCGAGGQAASALRDFGFHLGLAFQAIDDVLGIWGEAEVTGKPAWSDLRQRKKTLPVVAALEAPGAHRDSLRSILAREHLDEEELRLLADLVEEGGGRARTLSEAERQLAAAMASLAEAPLEPGARRELEAVGAFVGARTF